MKAARLWIIVVVIAVLGISAFGITWMANQETQMSIHGWIALILSVVVSVGLWLGLMVLSIYSNRQGFDDAHGSGDGPDGPSGV